MELKTIEQFLEEKYSKVYEMSIPRKKAEDICTSLGWQIFEHLVKVLYWEDSINYNKHLNDIDNWINKIDMIELKPKNKKVQEKDLYNWLYDEFHSSSNQLNKVINKLSKSYSSLKVINNKESLNIKLKEIYTKLCIDLSSDNFNTIKDYI